MRLFVVRLSVIVIIASLLSGCGESRRSADMWPKMEKKQIFEVLDNYVKAVNDADADLLESLFWTEDPRFCEVENDQPMPFGKEHFLEIADWIREHGRPGDNRQRFQDTVVYMLAPDAAYTVSLREEVNTEKTSRVTLVLVRKEGEWRILHAHFSCVPED